MNGIIVINKEKGCTSHDVVYKVKKLFKEKVGHTGTLDPNATGVLPILVGKGTSLSEFLINHNKKYIATLKLGIKTDTADVEGNIIEECVVNKDLITEQNIKKVFNGIIGKQKQKPPMYSAVKINGKKLYEYARSGKSVNIPDREIEIYEINLLEINIEESIIKFEVACSKGTYIRTLCENIAEKLNTIGYMADLNRVQVGEFKIEDSITISELETNLNDDEFLKKHFINVEDFFKNREIVILDTKQMLHFLNGVEICCSASGDVARVYDENGNFIGIGVMQSNRIKRKIIL